MLNSEVAEFSLSVLNPEIHPSDVNLRWAIATIAGLEMPHWLLHEINDHLDRCPDCSSRVRRWRYKALISGREVFVGRSDISIG